MGGEGVDAVVRETSDSDRGAMDLLGIGGHLRDSCCPVTARCCGLGLGRKKVSVGFKAHSSWCLGCRRSQAQLILNTDSSHILDVCWMCACQLSSPNTSFLEFL